MCTLISSSDNYHRSGIRSTTDAILPGSVQLEVHSRSAKRFCESKIILITRILPKCLYMQSIYVRIPRLTSYYVKSFFMIQFPSAHSSITLCKSFNLIGLTIYPLMPEFCAFAKLAGKLSAVIATISGLIPGCPFIP